ncbi:gluconate 2-dehydrogenase subunit 3 family protein [Xanthomonas massiliensis]|uniref:gluconate 2-dehydrogenase subunit 3 family protein n=1 Tax=Xanthomonas massiliensis TaxID=1720302 RepID=UPI000826F0E0|nr:gluconate 2-dehydrogenase subunit 3 family protein [Xanthomonas massiliensis]
MSDPTSPEAMSPSRRRLFKSLGLIPLAAALPACSPAPSGSATKAEADSGKPYAPTFFTAAQYACLVAAADRLIPHDAIGPGAVELDVPQFIDKHMATPYASGAIWYMQGPFLEASKEFGYQGKLALRDILRVGLDALDKHCASVFAGKSFAALEPAQQETLLKGVEKGEVELDAIDAKTFFSYLLGEVRNGYFADPVHGGNKGMGSWKMIGYPGMRADYLDWVEVRDRPYPLGPVDLAGRRA